MKGDVPAGAYQQAIGGAYGGMYGGVYGAGYPPGAYVAGGYGGVYPQQGYGGEYGTLRPLLLESCAREIMLCCAFCLETGLASCRIQHGWQKPRLRQDLLQSDRLTTFLQRRDLISTDV